MSSAKLLHLRPYQREAIDAVWRSWAEGVQRPAIVLATGLGKTVVFSHLVSEYIEKTNERVVILVHRDELADQALAKLRDVAPHLVTGKVKAKDNEAGADVVVASVQTLARVGRLEQLGRRGLVIADECHHFSSPTFKKVLESLTCFQDGGAKLLGVTATMSRSDGRGLGDVFQEVVYTRGTLYGIKHGFLVRPTGRLIVAGDLDLGNVKTSRGDYQTGDLGRAVEESGLAEILPAAYREHANERQGIVFTPTVANAEHVADAFSAAGIPAAMLSGDTPRSERLAIFEQYRRGKLQVMTNAMVLSEGFDMPQAEVAVIARPTRSNSLYQQMVGRILRPSPITGKTGALILDVVGASLDNKLMTLIDLEPGMFKDRTPCEVCECIPCVCPCANCGESRVNCTCEKAERGGVQLLEEGIQGELDLFSSSSQAWLSTRRGVMFIPCGNSEVFLWPSWTEEGLFMVGRYPKNSKRPEWLHRNLQLGTAQAWAETEAEELQDFSTRRTATWRKKKASDSQKNYAKQLGIPYGEGTLAGELGNLISIELASRRLDPKVKTD